MAQRTDLVIQDCAMAKITPSERSRTLMGLEATPQNRPPVPIRPHVEDPPNEPGLRPPVL